MSLPSGAIRLNWIQSTGTQYVDTLVSHSATSNIILKAEVSYDTVSPANQIMGFNGSGGNGIGISGATWWEASSIASAKVGTRYSFEYGVNGASWYRTVNGTSVSGSRGSYSFTSNLFLFAAMASVTSATMAYFCSCKLYSAKVLVNGSVVRDFIPCKLSDGTVGLWDDVNSVFYGNAGTGTFVSGPAAEFTELEYIDSSGTQYIDTSFAPSGNKLQIVTKFRYTVEHNNMSTFGNATNSPYSITVYGSKPVFYVGSTNSISCGDQTILNVDYVLDVIADNGTLKAIWNDIEYAAAYSGALNTSNTVYIFGSNNNGVVAETGNGYRLYAFQIYDNEVLARDYIPAKTIEGEVGLYDKVNSEFYRNAGTGEFIAGPELVIALDPPAAVEQIINVKLAWTAVEKATFYRVYRDGVLIGEAEDTVYTDATAELGQTYVYGITACRGSRESDPTELTVYTREGYAVIRPVVTTANFP